MDLTSQVSRSVGIFYKTQLLSVSEVLLLKQLYRTIIRSYIAQWHLSLFSTTIKKYYHSEICHALIQQN